MPHQTPHRFRGSARRFLAFLVTFLLALILAGSLHAQATQPAAAPGGTAASVTIWSKSQGPPKVFFNEAIPATRAAAITLAKYLSAVTSTQVTPAKIKAPADEEAFYVGFRDPQALFAPNATFSVETTPGGQVFVDGVSPATDLQVAVMDLVQNELKCRIWSHNEQDLPKQDALAFAASKRAPIPAFRQLYLFNKEAFGMPGDFKYAIKAKQGPEFTGNHTLYPLLESTFKEHPEFLPADDKGVRKPSIHLCYTAKGLPEALAKALSAEVEQRKGNVKDFIYFAGPGDWYGGMCKCPVCTKVYDEEAWTNADGKVFKGYSATLVRMINETGKLLDQKYPGAQIGTFAYMSLDNPPAITKPGPNVHIQLPRLRYDSCTAVDVSPKNRNVYLAMQKWAEIAPNRFYIWEYGANFSNFLEPFPDTHAMAQNIKVYHKMGVTGLYIQGNYVSPGSDMVVLKNWVWSRLIWDPTLNIDAVIREFCDGYYGPAGNIMFEYVRALDDSVKNPQPIVVSEFADANKTFLTPELETKLYGILDEAMEQAKTKPTPYLTRVKEARASLEAARLWRAGPLVEKEGRLVRSDFPYDPFEEARDLLAHIRGSSVREWSTGRNNQLAFAAWYGGPIHTLNQDKLQAVLAPVQGGITRVTFDGVNIIQNIYSQPVGCDGVFVEQGGNYASIKVETGIGAWSPDTKAFNVSYFQLLPGNRIRMTTTLTGVRKTDPKDPLHAGYRTAYRVINGEAPKIELMRLETPTNFPYKAGAKNVPLGRFDSIRISYPKAGIVLEDSYPEMQGLSGTLSQSAVGSSVVVTVSTEPLDLIPNKPYEAPVRVLEFKKTK
jgi:hypothetical protein